MRFSRLVSLISLTILSALGLVIVSSWATKYSLISGRRFSNELSQTILYIANLPNKVNDLTKFLSNRFPPSGENNPYQKLFPVSSSNTNVAGYILIPYVHSNGSSRVILLNTSNQTSKEIFLFDINKQPADYADTLVQSLGFRHSPYSSRHRVTHPYLNKDGRLYYIIPWNDLVCFNTILNKEEWRVKGAFHHSVEVDSEGNIWACGATAPGSLRQNNKKLLKSQNFEDQAIVKISNQGKIIDSISIADLLIDGGMEYLLFGCSNPKFVFDPIHLNHVNPVNGDYGKIKKGTVLVSLRNLSTVLLIDPNSRKIEWSQTGPWMNQHCVNPIGNNSISVLDNHAFIFGVDQYWLDPSWQTQVVTQNIEKNETKTVELNFKRDSIQIPIEGRSIQISPESWIIEDSVHGTIFLFHNQKIILKWSNVYPNGKVGYTSWCRFMRTEEISDIYLN